MPEADAMSARHAALLVHGLSPTERLQVVARLDDGERSRLQPLLDELRDLGIPPSEVGDMVELHRSDAAPPAPSTVEGRVALLEPDLVLRCLSICSPATAACLLEASAWPWREEVLARFDLSRRNAVAACVLDDAPRLSTAMIGGLCNCLLQAANHLAPSMASGVRGKAAEASSPVPFRRLSRRWFPWMR